MTIEEVVRNYIKETVKPLTPDQARIKALKGNVDRARLALQTARDQQRQRREAERRAKAAQAQAARRGHCLIFANSFCKARLAISVSNRT
jgi:septal ring factor EnvC (AmiA/AmiB activator)